MTVDDIIENIDKISKNQEQTIILRLNGKTYTSFFDTDSWRGSYSMPAISAQKEESGCTVKEALENLAKTDGKEVTGWKGGDYILDSSDRLFVTSGSSTSLLDNHESVFIKNIFLEDDIIVFELETNGY